MWHPELKSEIFLSATSSFITCQFFQACCLQRESVSHVLGKNAVYWWTCRHEFKNVVEHGPTEGDGLPALI